MIYKWENGDLVRRLKQTLYVDLECLTCGGTFTSNIPIPTMLCLSFAEEENITFEHVDKMKEWVKTITYIPHVSYGVIATDTATIECPFCEEDITIIKNISIKTE